MPSKDAVGLDTGSTLKVTLKDSDDQSAIDLTGGSAVLRLTTDGGETTEDHDMTLDTPASGIVTYKFKEGDLFKGFGPGSSTAMAEVIATLASGDVIRNADLIVLRVRRPLKEPTP